MLFPGGSSEDQSDAGEPRDSVCALVHTAVSSVSSGARGSVPTVEHRRLENGTTSEAVRKTDS